VITAREKAIAEAADPEARTFADGCPEGVFAEHAVRGYRLALAVVEAAEAYREARQRRITVGDGFDLWPAEVAFVAALEAWKSTT
jgi:hypothetical protein